MLRDASRHQHDARRHEGQSSMIAFVDTKTSIEFRCFLSFVPNLDPKKGISDGCTKNPKEERRRKGGKMVTGEAKESRRENGEKGYGNGRNTEGWGLQRREEIKNERRLRRRG
ncbi:hypothetical protein Scep_011776 [Stephania cephalantha]|uniref:Uncharacterized protein n=1 Tax=Stephania cephalantha TaxID=152367 RepID=A0AAP0P666_9MAGN